MSLRAEKGRKGDSRVVLTHTHGHNTCKGLKGKGGECGERGEQGREIIGSGKREKRGF